MSDAIREVPLVDLGRQYAEVRVEVEAAVSRVLASGTYITGPEVAAFEDEVAGYLGVDHAIGVGSGTDALYLILRALGIGPGDEVVTTDSTFIATADTIARCGATPVFADIDPRTFDIDPTEAARRMTDRTRAIVAVHLYGHPADMAPLSDVARSAGVHLIEDCAQAFGAEYRGRKVGSLGTASAFSFFPTKNLGAAGDGGLVCTGDGAVAERVRTLRSHGSRKKYLCEEIGLNSRLDEVQAAMLRIKLRRLDAWNRSRVEVASWYDENLAGVGVPFVAPDVSHVYHLYTVRAERREALADRLAAARVGFNVYYPVPLHLQPCFGSLGHKTGDFPASERAASEVLSLPIFPGMTREELLYVRAAVNGASV